MHTISQIDKKMMKVAIEIALESENEGNLPVGAVITLDGKIIGKGNSAVLKPEYHPGRHAEIQALKSVDAELWPQSHHMTCYTTLEPCVMCYSTMLLHGIGRIVFGAWDTEGGCSAIIPHLPEYYADGKNIPKITGPTHPQECDPLYERTRAIFDDLPCGKLNHHPYKSA